MTVKSISLVCIYVLYLKSGSCSRFFFPLLLLPSSLCVCAAPFSFLFLHKIEFSVSIQFDRCASHGHFECLVTSNVLCFCFCFCLAVIRSINALAPMTDQISNSIEETRTYQMIYTALMKKSLIKMVGDVYMCSSFFWFLHSFQFSYFSTSENHKV